jgi:hypothetical protein
MDIIRTREYRVLIDGDPISLPIVARNLREAAESARAYAENGERIEIFTDRGVHTWTRGALGNQYNGYEAIN